ncbi:MAG: YwaF family protein [Clostridia bacterium]|nr:YwaF family protein [Clostridia bacterium]
MSFWVKLLEFLETKGETPTMYGAFHIVFIVLVALATFLLCKFFGSSSERTYRRIVLIGWIAMVVLEVYKQIIYAVSFENGAFVWDYEWYAFPYQLCSTPLYVMPFAALLKNGRVRDAAMAYLATFSFFGGLVVFIYPGDVFVSTIGISAQSMIHHGMQIVIGIYTAFYNRKRFNFGFFLHAVPAFAALCAAALIMNIGVYHAFAASGIEDTFNMFYISPYFPCTLPLLGDVIWPNVPYAAFLVIYILGFCIAAYVLYIIQYGLMRLGGNRVKS